MFKGDGVWFSARIVKVHRSKKGKEATYDLHYADGSGDRETQVKKSFIRLHEWNSDDETPAPGDRITVPTIDNVIYYICQISDCKDDAFHQCSQVDCGKVVCKRHEQHSYHGGLTMGDLIKKMALPSTVNIVTNVTSGCNVLEGASFTGCTVSSILKRSSPESPTEKGPESKKSKLSRPLVSVVSSDDEEETEKSSSDDSSESESSSEGSSEDSSEISPSSIATKDDSDLIVSPDDAPQGTRGEHKANKKKKKQKQKLGIIRKQQPLATAVSTLSSSWLGYTKYLRTGPDPHDTYKDSRSQGKLLCRCFEHYAVCLSCYAIGTEVNEGVGRQPWDILIGKDTQGGGRQR
jgi:hypothetical protein